VMWDSHFFNSIIGPHMQWWDPTPIPQLHMWINDV
jgi:hypothetical protein